MKKWATKPSTPPSPNPQTPDPSPLPPHTSLFTVINNRTILAAWDQAMRILEFDIRSDVYQTYIAPTYPKQWISPGILTIAGPTPYIRDWLTDRLTSTLSRLLCGILAQPVSLLFKCIS